MIPHPLIMKAERLKSMLWCFAKRTPSFNTDCGVRPPSTPHNGVRSIFSRVSRRSTRTHIACLVRHVLLPKVSRGPPDSRPEAESRHEAPVEIQRMISPRRRRVMTLRQICHMGEVSLPRVGVKTMAPPPPAHTLRERDDTR